MRPKHFYLCFLLLTLVGVCVAAVTPSSKPNVILITIDTTRADRMGFLGSQLRLTPQLDSLAHDAVAFANCFAQVPLTTPSHATILSGTYPQFSHVNNLGDPLTASTPYLPDILHQHGYATAAFIGGAVLDPGPGGAVGFDRGFDLYDAHFHRRAPGEDRYQSVERRAEVVVEHATGWLAKQHGAFFLWVHLYDPHDPYDPPEPFKTRYASAPYDGEIAYTDSQIGKFLAFLRQHGLYDNSLIAVMADHGEALGDHGEQTHGVFLYDETLRVPLLFKLPAAKTGSHIADHVGLVDVAPTILDLLGMAVPEAMQGASLAKQMRPDASRADRPEYAESQYGHDAYGWAVLRSWRAGKYVFIQAPRRELYDHATDPKELRNLASQTQAVADTLSAELENFHRRTSSQASSKTELSPEAVESLRALGYVSAASPANDKAGASHLDPKDRIGFANSMHSALIDLEEERYRDAIPELEAALKVDPDAGPTYIELGNAWLQVKEVERATPPLQKAIVLMPESEKAHELLGEALVGQRQWTAAASEFEAAITRNPNSADLHVNLGSVYEQLNRVPDATDQFEKAASLAPGDYQANLLAGRMLGMHGSPQAALQYLQAAEALQPESPEVHHFLANVYAALGRNDEAENERAEARRLRAQIAPK